MSRFPLTDLPLSGVLCGLQLCRSRTGLTVASASQYAWEEVRLYGSEENNLRKGQDNDKI